MNAKEKEFLTMLEKHTGILRKVANSYAKNSDDRDDLIQEISFHLWKSWASYNSKYKLSTWIYRVALNVAISFFRKHYKLLDVPSTSDYQVWVEGEQQASKNASIQLLYHQIAQLPPLNRALMLLYLDQYNHDEIAEVIGISKSNVATKIGRIKKDLQHKMTSYERD